MYCTLGLGESVVQARNQFGTPGGRRVF